MKFSKKSNWNPIEIEKNQKNRKNRKDNPKKSKKNQKNQKQIEKNPKDIEKNRKKSKTFLIFFLSDFSSLIHNRIEIQLKS